MSPGHAAVVFLLAAAVGFASAIPMGPIGILTVSRALSKGFWRAFVPTLGAVAADGIFGLIAAFGVSFVSEALLRERFWLRLAGCALLFTVGVTLLIRVNNSGRSGRKSAGSRRIMAAYFTLAMSNPLTLLFYLAAFSALGLHGGADDLLDAIFISGGIVAGTIAWFLLISAIAGLFHRRIAESSLRKVRLATGWFFVVSSLVLLFFLLFTQNLL